MSILNVDKIQPIGSGSTVTVNATDTILTNAQAGVITATRFDGIISATTDDWITHQGDSNTKFGFSTTDTFAVETAGTERLKIDSSGHVIITNKLTNSSSYTSHNANFYGGNVNTGGVRIEVAHSTTSVSGNTASASFPHHLLLSNYSGTGSADNRMCSIGFDIPTTSTHANAVIAYQATAAGTGDLQFHLESGNSISERLRITSAGKVGIATATPTAKLDVYGSGSTSVIRGRRTDSNGGWNIFEGYSDINGANVFTVSNNGVGYFKGGIDFSAQTSTSASGATTTHEVLDHYEEGSWTPTLTNGFTFGSLTARYTRIGNVVYLYLNLYRNDSSSKTSDLEITNLPFAMGSYTNSMGMGLAFSYNGTNDRRCGFINTNNASSVKVIKDGTSSYVSYDNFVVNSRALTMKWWYYTA